MRYLTATCSPGWGNLVTFDWNGLPVGREFNGKFLKNVKSPHHASPPPPHPHRQLVDIDRCITPAGQLEELMLAEAGVGKAAGQLKELMLGLVK